VSLALRNLLFTLVVPGAVAVYVPLFVFDHGSAADGWSFAPALLLLALGAAIYAWCVWDFAVAGRGTPSPNDPPRALVVRGLYRHTRNPMYVGVITVVSGWAALFREPRLALYALAVLICFHLRVRLYEEPKLAELFGDDYARYRARVPRWFPRLGRREG